MTPEQMNAISKLGYMVMDKGNAVMCMSTKEMVLTVNAEGKHVTEVPEIKDILGIDKPKKKTAPKKTKAKVKETELVMERARDENGHFIADDPDTEVNEAWIVKTIKKAIKK
jgi:hypothetical protein